MPRKPSQTFNDKELEVMRVIWTRGAATVKDVQQALPGNHHYNSVLSVVRVLESKGHLTHTGEGRAYLYRATVSPEKARKKVLSHLVKHLFGGSAASLVANLVETGDLTKEELDEIRRQFSEHKA